MKYEAYFKKELGFIERGLKKVLTCRVKSPGVMRRAVRYAVFTGGKRFRPVLTLAACEACGGRRRDAVLPAIAIEMIHTYSLVHDDLPALDDDDFRRGNPTCHRQFGEANAILAGDALLTLAFELLAEVRPPRKAVLVAREIAAAAGVLGMIGGQVADLADQGREKNYKEHLDISRRKTGALIRVSVLAGAVAAAASPRTRKAMARYGEYLGLAFQFVDDVLDRDGICKAIGPWGAAQKAIELIGKAKAAVRCFGPRATKLNYLADFLAARIPAADERK
ncbi:MAG: polyprenyl synthetase family protein [Candidatus Omnitrophica bacterium]|nr:polyprenyl synthetase family protein [Candidatus Omnitrophota bacterium]